jgi:CubicO group peptidase (beta-lactamase class C family)
VLQAFHLWCHKQINMQHKIVNKRESIQRTSSIIFLLVFSAFILLCITSCQKEKLVNTPPLTKEFNAVKFRQFIATALSSGGSPARGYSIVVNKGGNWVDTFSSGWAYRNATGGGYAPMHVNQEINVASVSKTITAVGVLQLLNKNNLTIDSTIGGWLPAYWNAATVVKNLTFKQLLTHSSGLLESNTGYDSLKVTVARGLDNPAKPLNTYANINFALFRAIIPYLVNKTAAATQEAAMLPANASGFENWLSQEYVKYMQEKVWTPIGISSATCTPSANTAMGFNENNGNGPVDIVVTGNNGDWTNTCGGGGYYLSVMEMARFNAYLAHATSLLSSEQRLLMDAQRLGWDTGDSPMTDMGQAYGKDGALFWDLNNNNTPDVGEAGLETLIMKFPHGIELSLVVTSFPGSWRTLSSIARNAYNISWEEK